MENARASYQVPWEHEQIMTCPLNACSNTIQLAGGWPKIQGEDYVWAYEL